jgi:glycosyltransferase involved in cell wall biosynthesis
LGYGTGFGRSSRSRPAKSSGSRPSIDDGRTGFVRDSDEDLADCLLRAADLDRAACRKAAEERFSTERMVTDHLDLYREVIAGPAAPAPRESVG